MDDRLIRDDAIIAAEEADEQARAQRISLFTLGDFVSHSGFALSWKIECDALTDEDWVTLAAIISQTLPAFGPVEGVPQGGLKLAAALEPHRRHGPLLIVDDVLTTGQSMEDHRNGREAIGVVVFARSLAPEWVTPLFLVMANARQ